MRKQISSIFIVLFIFYFQSVHSQVLNYECTDILKENLGVSYLEYVIESKSDSVITLSSIYANSYRGYYIGFIDENFKESEFIKIDKSKRHFGGFIRSDSIFIIEGEFTKRNFNISISYLDQSEKKLKRNIVTSFNLSQKGKSRYKDLTSFKQHYTRHLEYSRNRNYFGFVLEFKNRRRTFYKPVVIDIATNKIKLMKTLEMPLISRFDELLVTNNGEVFLKFNNNKARLYHFFNDKNTEIDFDNIYSGIISDVFIEEFDSKYLVGIISSAKKSGREDKFQKVITTHLDKENLEFGKTYLYDLEKDDYVNAPKINSLTNGKIKGIYLKDDKISSLIYVQKKTGRQMNLPNGDTRQISSSYFTTKFICFNGERVKVLSSEFDPSQNYSWASFHITSDLQKDMIYIFASPSYYDYGQMMVLKESKEIEKISLDKESNNLLPFSSESVHFYSQISRNLYFRKINVFGSKTQFIRARLEEY